MLKLIVLVLVSAFAVVLAPQPASATYYHQFRIENHTTVELQFVSEHQPSNNGYGVRPPASIAAAREADFSVVFWSLYYSYSEIAYRFADDDGTPRTLHLTTYRSTVDDWSTCSTDSPVYACTPVAWDSTSPTRFVVDRAAPLDERVSSQADSARWRALMALCIDPGIARCDGYDDGPWTLRLGNAVYALDNDLTWDVDLPEGRVGKPYVGHIVSNQSDALGFTTKVLNMPPGLSLDAPTGRITGTPLGAAAGGTTVDVYLIGPDGRHIGFKSVRLPISWGPYIPTTQTLPTGKIGTAYAASIKAFVPAGTREDPKWSVTGLPSGMSFRKSTDSRLAIQSQSAVLLSGTPTAAGRYPLSITVSTPSGSSTFTVPLVIEGLKTPVTVETLPSATVGKSIVTRLVKAEYFNRGPEQPVVIVRVTGLPPRIEFDRRTGLIFGAPTRAGTFTITASVTTPAGTRFNSIQLVVKPALTG